MLGQIETHAGGGYTHAQIAGWTPACQLKDTQRESRVYLAGKLVTTVDSFIKCRECYVAQLLTATRLNVQSVLCVFSPSLFSLLTAFIFFIVVIADAAACVFLENTSWACCKHASSEGFWLPFDSADRRAFIVTDGSINTMKLNPSSAVCLYLYMYACVSVSSPAYIDFLPLSTISVHSALLPLQEIFFLSSSTTPHNLCSELSERF